MHHSEGFKVMAEMRVRRWGKEAGWMGGASRWDGWVGLGEEVGWMGGARRRDGWVGQGGGMDGRGE